jgi:hypothetical protein
LVVLILGGLTACGPKKTHDVADVLLPVPSVDEILSHAVEAAGGEAVLRAHQSARFEGQMRMAAQGITAPMTLLQRAPSTSYSRVELPGVGVMEEGVEGDLAWARDPLTGPRLKEGVEKAQAIRGADLTYLLDIATHYPTREVVGPRVIEDHAVWELRLVPVEGEPELAWFDRQTYDWVGGRMTVESAMGKRQITTISDDYREVDGERVPFHMTISNALMSTEILWTQISFNVPDLAIPPVPDEIRALSPQP